MNNKVEYALKQYEAAAARLTEGIASVKNDLDKDGVIQRFEFTFELLWKTLKILFEYKGVTGNKYPRDFLKEAFKMDIIDDEKIFLNMLDDRNILSHMYNKEISDQVYGRIVSLYGRKLEEITARMRNELK
jgi:nucleotidyltransferase substrate binding protein (TIGR01987 family)